MDGAADFLSVEEEEQPVEENEAQEPEEKPEEKPKPKPRGRGRGRVGGIREDYEKARGPLWIA